MVARKRTVLTGPPMVWSSRNFFAVFEIDSFCLAGSFSSGAGTWDGYIASSHCCQSTLGGVDSSAKRAKFISGDRFTDSGFYRRMLVSPIRVF